ncbi:hypothetical protein Mapa_011153 [Marchantia paleacea]|nr:hypothetical protein Mapa_011153 [Marchantia paleacea]
MDSEKDSVVSESKEDLAQYVAGGTMVGDDLIWKEIDYSETCLVSSMYQEAIEAATSCLRELSKRVTDEGAWLSAEARSLSAEPYSQKYGEDVGELFSMMEASGMVLLQALSGLGRSSEIFDVLTSVFNSVSRVPYSLFLTGICLQLSVGLHGSAKNALEEYLNGWKSLEKGAAGLLTKSVIPIGSCQRVVREVGSASCFLHLTKTGFLQLTEIYVIEVLVIGLKNPKAALLWITQTNISEDKKKVIIEKIQHIMQQERAKAKQKEQSADSFCASTASPVGTPPRTREQTNGAKRNDQDSLGDAHAADGAPKDQSSPKGPGQSNSRAVSKGSGFCGRFPFARTVCKLIELVMVRIRAHLFSHSDGLPEGKLLLTGAFTSILVIALLRNRRKVLRIFSILMNPVKTALSDLWQQAFSVQLNPLAAAQPFPTARSLVA